MTGILKASMRRFTCGMAKARSSVRFGHLVDSVVARGALSKGRSPSRALQPLTRKAGAVCVACDLYPAWGYTPTRLNVADDPTRDRPLRGPAEKTLFDFGLSSLSLRDFSGGGLKRYAANWARLVSLWFLLHQPVFAFPDDGYHPD